MTRLAWIAITLLLLLATMGLSSHLEIREIMRDREWFLTRTGPEGAELLGVRGEVEAITAIVAQDAPDRALVHVRLGLAGPKEAREAWVDCRVSLRDGQNRVWLPLQAYAADKMIEMLAPDGVNNRLCGPGLEVAQADRTIVSDQLFLVPAAVTKELTVHVSGFGTRPEALAMKVAPGIRMLP